MLEIFDGIHWTLVIYLLAAVIAARLMMPKIKAWLSNRKLCRIDINDDLALTKTSPKGTPLLTALRGNHIFIPSPCNNKGTCKQCRIKFKANAPEVSTADRAAFDLSMLKEGWRLACQAKVNGHMHLHIDPQTFKVREFSGTVISNDNVSTFIKELVIQLPPGEEIDYQPGSYMQFHLPPFKTNSADWKQTMHPKFYADWEKNGMFGQEIDFSHLATGHESIVCAFSMASYPAEKNILKFNIRIATPPLVNGKLTDKIAWGACSSYAFALKPGDTVGFSGPYGEAFMINDDRDVVFLIGGAGSSFGRSHIMHLFQTEHTKRKVTLWYGARSLKEQIYRDEFEQLAMKNPNFDYHLVLSEPSQEDIQGGWQPQDPLKTNMLFRAFEAGELKQRQSPQNCLFYVCGPPMHNQSVMKLLADYRVPRENIILDDFGI